MAKKSSFKDTKWGFIGINILIAIIVATVLLVGLVIGLRIYTQHGKEVVVPNITNLYIEEAKIIAEAEGSSFQRTWMVLVLGLTAPFWICRHGKASLVEEADAQRDGMASLAFKVFLLPQVVRRKKQ